MRRSLLSAALPLALLMLSAAPAMAHKVIVDIFPAGGVVEGEIGFSSGIMAADARVTVTGPDGEPLGEVRTDADGFFTFRPTRPVAHSFRADLGAGHVAVMELSAEEAARIIAAGGATSAPAPEPAPAPAPAAVGPAEPAPAAAAPLSAAQKAEIARLLRDEIRPLRREISAYKEKNDLTTILGGLGWIAGLFGLGFYLAARARLKRGG